MKKIIYAVLATLSGLVLLFSYRTSLGEAIPDRRCRTGHHVDEHVELGRIVGSGSSGSIGRRLDAPG